MPDSAAPSTPHVEALDAVDVENEDEPPCGATSPSPGGALHEDVEDYAMPDEDASETSTSWQTAAIAARLSR